jgi:hypothetical protein
LEKRMNHGEKWIKEGESGALIARRLVLRPYAFRQTQNGKIYSNKKGRNISEPCLF